MWLLISRDDVLRIHDEVIGAKELQNLAQDKSLEGALARVEYRMQYGIIEDVFDLAATYAVTLARGHVFNDANKRTAYMVMHACLALNGVEVVFENTEVADLIIEAAQGRIDEHELAARLRSKAM